MTSVSPTSQHAGLHDQMRPLPHHTHVPSPVRLPPVSTIPRDDLLQPQQGFNASRRVSITDPFLHAYPPPPDLANGPLPSPDPYLTHTHAPGGLRRSSDEAPPGAKVGLHSPTPRSGSPSGTGGSGATGGPSAMGPPPSHQQRYPGVAPAPHYEFGSSFTNGHGSAPPSYQTPPTSNYRFGAGQHHEPHGPSYFDYSMRRHSLTNTHVQPSPPRLPSIDASVPGVGGPLKRKSSSDDPLGDDGYPFPSGPYPSHFAGPYPKRRGSSLTYDKLGNMSLSDQRRDSMLSSPGTNPAWDDDRRGSNGSYGSQGSQGYMSSNYSVPTPVDPYDQRSLQVQQQQSYAHHVHQRHLSEPHLVYNSHVQHQHPPPHHSQGPRGSISMAPPGSMESEMAYGRRMSVPGVNHMMQGPPGMMYQNEPSQYGNSRRSSGGALPSVAHSPPDEGPPRHPHPGAAALPPAHAAWARAGPLPTMEPQMRQIPRHDSLDPMAAYGPGGKMETPYSRSPELRVSHKLAERKRRKEMAQLFDELREALPVDRGLKSSKWEILSKAVDYIITLKEHNSALARDNTMLRDHFGLGPGPQAHRMPVSSHSPPEHSYPVNSPHGGVAPPPPHNLSPHNSQHGSPLLASPHSAQMVSPTAIPSQSPRAGSQSMSVSPRPASHSASPRGNLVTSPRGGPPLHQSQEMWPTHSTHPDSSTVAAVGDAQRYSPHSSVQSPIYEATANRGGSDLREAPSEPVSAAT